MPLPEQRHLSDVPKVDIEQILTADQINQLMEDLHAIVPHALRHEIRLFLITIISVGDSQSFLDARKSVDEILFWRIEEIQGYFNEALLSHGIGDVLREHALYGVYNTEE